MGLLHPHPSCAAGDGASTLEGPRGGLVPSRLFDVAAGLNSRKVYIWNEVSQK